MDPSANRSYDFIDGLRGVAILMVVTGHFIYFKEQNKFVFQFLRTFSGALGCGVFLFFTLSGFLISWPFWKRKKTHAGSQIPPGYGWRRFWKIYPPLALSILLLAPCFILWRGNSPLYIRTACEWLTGLAFVMPVSGKFNPVMWSLVVEIHFYIILPILFVFTKPLSARACLWVITLFLFGVPVLIQSLTGLTPTFFPEISDPFFTGLSNFCLGVGLAGLDNLSLWNKSWSRMASVGWLLMIGALAGMAWVQMNPLSHPAFQGHLCYWTFMLGTGCLLCYASDPQHPRVDWLCVPWLRWCGIISYEWYLFHQPMVYMSRDFFGPAGGHFLKYAVVIFVPLLASLTFSALVYRFFSLPILKFGRAKKSAQK